MIMPILEKDLATARTAWGNGLLEISKSFETDGIEMARKVAGNMLDTLYGFDLGQVLFKPTLSGGNQTFRLTKEGALSYYTGQNSVYPNDVGFGVLNLSELIDVDSILSEIEFNDVSPSEDVWIHDSFRLEEKTPSQWLDERTDGGDVLGDLTSLPWDGSGAVGPFLANGQNWTKRLVPNGEDLRMTMSFPSSPEPYLVEDLQLVARTSTGCVTVGDYYDGDGFSEWFDGSVILDDDALFNSNNETTVEIKFSSLDLIDVEWLDVVVRARYLSPGNNPGYTGVGGDRLRFALAAKGVVRASLNWEDSAADGFANAKDSSPTEATIH